MPHSRDGGVHQVHERHVARAGGQVVDALDREIEIAAIGYAGQRIAYSFRGPITTRARR